METRTEVSRRDKFSYRSRSRSRTKSRSRSHHSRSRSRSKSRSKDLYETGNAKRRRDSPERKAKPEISREDRGRARERDGDRGRGGEDRDRRRDRESGRDGSREREKVRGDGSKDRERGRDDGSKDRERTRGDGSKDRERTRGDGSKDRERVRDGGSKDREPEQERLSRYWECEKDHGVNRDREREQDRNVSREYDRNSKTRRDREESGERKPRGDLEDNGDRRTHRYREDSVERKRRRDREYDRDRDDSGERKKQRDREYNRDRDDSGDRKRRRERDGDRSRDTRRNREDDEDSKIRNDREYDVRKTRRDRDDTNELDTSRDREYDRDRKTRQNKEGGTDPKASRNLETDRYINKGRDQRNRDAPSSNNDRRQKSPVPVVSKGKKSSKTESTSSSDSNSDRKIKKSSKKKKSKKSKKKKSSSDSDSNSSDSDSETELMIRLEKDRAKQLEDAKKRKERMKAMETPEEKRLRRLMKKDEKERKRKERMGWDNEYLHYTNTDNPFGDGNLLDTFVWKKKLEKDGLEDISREEVERINRFKQEESKLELEKVKKRRIERELERERREEEETLLQRQKEAAQFKEWGNQEDLFHLEQARLRSKIRIKDGRAKPIDLLAQYISAEEEVNAIEMHEPYTYLNGLTVTDLEDLIEDIKVYKELERGKNLNYWNDITVIVEDELRKLRKLEQDDDYRVAMDRREGINPAVANEVSAIFKGKSTEQLQQLKAQIQGKLDGSSSGVDISYWESLLSQLKAHIARAQLRDRHQENLLKKLTLLKAEQGVEGEENDEEPGPSDPNKIEIDDATQDSEPTQSTHETEEEGEEDVVGEAIIRYNAGSFSPKLISQDDIEPGIFVIGEEEDNARLHMARSQVLNVGQRVENVWTAEEKALQMEAKKGMDNDEAVFSVESPLEHVYLWSDKYRPRKPRYFNRVHTGFEWNKYNQTHYDMDNPPPKIVQGYKFNIFYPDLIDKNTTPSYHLSTCADNPDFAILRFHAGPPYEDIAFKIVNREWEYSYKRGFRCQFHNNIFQLWFHFKRYRYRR